MPIDYQFRLNRQRPLIMSSAFMVENILTADIDKDVAEHQHHHHHHHHHHLHHQQRCESMTSSSSDTESDVMSDVKDSLCGSPRSHGPDAMSPSVRHPPQLPDPDKLQLSESLLRTYAMIRQSGGLSEMCCTKCGHFQATPGDSPDSDVTDFKCAKCGGCETLTKDASTILSEAERTTTIVGVGGVGVTKPILKFSVSAILGDRKECVKVRNGK